MRMMFSDLSCEFTIIQSVFFCRNFRRHKGRPPLSHGSTRTWQTDYSLTCCVHNQVGSRITTPKGSVLSPFILTLYTSDFFSLKCSPLVTSESFICRNTDRTLQWSGLSEIDKRYKELVAWCWDNYLILNAKRKLLKICESIETCNIIIFIMGEDFGVAVRYKYDNTYQDYRVYWNAKVNPVCFLISWVKLDHFVCCRMMQIYHTCNLLNTKHKNRSFLSKDPFWL